MSGEGIDHIRFVVHDVEETYKDLVNGGDQPLNGLTVARKFDIK